MNKENYEIDEILEENRKKSLITVSFIEALDNNLTKEKAYKIMCDAFANFMITFYKKILNSTAKKSQERFDLFRKFYEDHAKKTPYLNIIYSNSKILKVKYDRCPFHEILNEKGLGEYSYAFCLSDNEFSEKVLSGVKFSRDHTIAQGGDYCDHTWELIKLAE